MRAGEGVGGLLGEALGLVEGAGEGVDRGEGLGERGVHCKRSLGEGETWVKRKFGGTDEMFTTETPRHGEE